LAEGVASTYVSETLQIVKDLLVAAAAVGGLIVASLGLKTWRKQLKGNTQYELSRRVLRAVFKTRDAMRQVRNPFISAAEFEQASKAAGFSSEEIQQNLRGVGSVGAVHESRWRFVIRLSWISKLRHLRQKSCEDIRFARN
jgi:hypothetical protein